MISRNITLDLSPDACSVSSTELKRFAMEQRNKCLYFSSGRMSYKGKLEAVSEQSGEDSNLNEKQIIQDLMKLFKLKGRKYSGFRSSLKLYLEYVEKSQEKPYCLNYRMFRNLGLLDLTLEARPGTKLRKEPLIDAAMDYLAAKYPSDFSDTSLIYFSSKNKGCFRN